MSGKVKGAAALRSDVGRYAMLPEWLLDAGISDKAIRLFGVIAAKYADRGGMAHPSRATLAEDCGLASAKTVDGPLRELEAAGAIVIEKRTNRGGAQIANVYTLSFSKPVKLAHIEQTPSPEIGTGGVPNQGLGGSPWAGVPPVPKSTPPPVPGEGHDPDKYLTRSNDPEKKDDRAEALPFSLHEPVTDQVTVLRARFERVCTVHPRVEKRKRAWKVFQTLNPSEGLTQFILDDIEKKKRTVWGGVAPQYITSLVNYLLEERWTDDVSEIAPYSASELAKARQLFASKYLGKCPHEECCPSGEDCIKNIALHERGHAAPQHQRAS